MVPLSEALTCVPFSTLAGSNAPERRNHVRGAADRRRTFALHFAAVRGAGALATLLPTLLGPTLPRRLPVISRSRYDVVVSPQPPPGASSADAKSSTQSQPQGTSSSEQGPTDPVVSPPRAQCGGRANPGNDRPGEGGAENSDRSRYDVVVTLQRVQAPRRVSALSPTGPLPSRPPWLLTPGWIRHQRHSAVMTRQCNARATYRRSSLTPYPFRGGPAIS